MTSGFKAKKEVLLSDFYGNSRQTEKIGYTESIALLHVFS
jgi:hypothetical protein